MHDSLHISAYTPSNTEPEILERMFVQREKLLLQTIKWCEEGIKTKKKNHLIFVGPRGSGKTHFVSMVVNRLKEKVKKDQELNDKLVLVWLGEDDVITNFIDLVLSILETLVRDYPNDFNKDCLQDAKGEKPDKVAEIILHSITQQIEGKTILLVKENMSDVFDGLKDNGQKKFRAYLQEQRNINILATSQQLFEGVSSRDNAFYGFFEVEHLKTLNVEDARQLISNIAEIKEDQDLVDFLNSPQGHYRIRALHHLAGGNHRLYVELAAFLTMETLDDFVSALNKLADNLTPYFQERVKSLPPQQGKIVQKLCELEGATPVKDIAEEMFINERSVAKQLGDLAKKGYVISHKRGKQSYYEMAEPLMRLSLEVKNNHGEPLKMVASLLRVWFSEEELSTTKSDDFLSKYQQAALSMGDEIIYTINNKILDQISNAQESHNFIEVITISSEILNTKNSISNEEELLLLYARSFAYFVLFSTELCLIDVNNALKLIDKSNIKYLFHKQFQDIKSSITSQKRSSLESLYFTLRVILGLNTNLWESHIQFIINHVRNEILDKHLGAALVFSISVFAENETLRSSFNRWNQLWLEYGSKTPKINYVLAMSEACCEAIEQKSDKPLLALPKELRDIVMPMIEDVLT